MLKLMPLLLNEDRKVFSGVISSSQSADTHGPRPLETQGEDEPQVLSLCLVSDWKESGWSKAVKGLALMLHLCSQA